MAELIDSHVLALLTPLLSALLGLGIFMIKRLVERVSRLEEKQCGNATRHEARTMINEKVEPVSKRIDNIDAKLDKIINILIQDK